MRILTADTIKRYDPCRDKLAIFEAEWPKGMSVTRANLDRAAVLGVRFMDWSWFMSRSFPPKLFGMFCKDMRFLAAELASGMLRYDEYDTLKFDWVYYYLLGIKTTQLEIPCVPAMY